jgi:hypothetical protein
MEALEGIRIAVSGRGHRGRFRDSLHGLTKKWGTRKEVTLYLDRCQVDTPPSVVEAVWRQVLRRRKTVGTVVDYGAGDGRFARLGKFKSYIGYEIDCHRWSDSDLPAGATLVNQCAFEHLAEDADVCVGNPPYVRNQDLPRGWRQRAAEILRKRSGIGLSGLANAWQYFFLLSLVSTKADGLVALVIPYEWVSRPSAASIREYIRTNGWGVEVYRMRDETFPRVLTTSSITIIDKADRRGRWNYAEEIATNRFRKLPSVTAGVKGVVAYARRTRPGTKFPFAKRGLSPGTQKVLLFTERERARLGLQIGKDVVPCITTLRHLPPNIESLDVQKFEKHYCLAGKKCWLIDTGRSPSAKLLAYLKAVPVSAYQTSTCLGREEWWRFVMPEIPELLVSSGFTGDSTKAVVNCVEARAVGSVCGIYRVAKRKRKRLAEAFRKVKLSDRIVAHSNGLRKLEINQMNTIVVDLL